MQKSCLLLILMLCLPLVSRADDSGTCGPNLTWTYVEATKTLTISGSGEMENYNEQFFYGNYITTAPWGTYYQIMQTVVIEFGVTSIGDNAFYECRNLTSITIPNSVTSIGDYAFRGCSGLTSITIPNSVTSIGDGAFSRCGGLTSITIPNSVTSIGERTFYNCSGLTSITIPNSVTSIGREAFLDTEWFDSQPDGLVYAGLVAYKYKGAVNSETVVEIKEGTLSIAGEAFSYCSGLTSITIPNSVTSIGNHAFLQCSSLTSITIPNSVTTIGNNAFYGTEWLNSQSDDLIYAGLVAYLYKGTMNSGTVVEIKEGTLGIAGGAFRDCSGLTSVTIPYSVTSIGDYAFSSCSGLTSITIPNNVTTIGDYAFSSCSGLTSITIPNCVTSIGRYAFDGCSGLTSITIPNSVTSIGDYAFSSCSGLASIIVSEGNPNYDSRDNCNAIIEKSSNNLITGCMNTIIPNSVTSIGNRAFSYCSGLTSITIPNSVTSIGDYAFRGCSGLTSITIPNSVTSIGDYAFRGCSGLTSITIPNSVTSIGDYAFLECSGLTSITIPNSVKSIGNGAFQYCSGLTSITIPNSVTSINVVFYYCRGLTSVVFSEGCQTVPANAFTECNKIRNITLPSTIQTIGNNAFPSSNTRDVYCYATSVASTNGSAFNASALPNATLHVPASALEYYRNTAPWSRFGTIVALDGTTLPQCAAPAIFYEDGRLEFASATEGAVCHYSVTDSDIQSGTGTSLTLSLTYHITAYATKEGYMKSDVSEATLCWVDYEPRQEGITTDMGNVKEESLADLQAKPVIITNHGGTLTISGAEDGTTVRVYDQSGALCGSGISLGNQARVTTNLPSGSIAIVQLGGRSVKVRMR